MPKPCSGASGSLPYHTGMSLRRLAVLVRVELAWLLGERRDLMRIRLLGPVAVTIGDRELDLGPSRRRTLLAALAVDPGSPVPMTTLVDRVWGDEPPAQVQSSVYGHVSRLRSLFPERSLRRSPAGYVLDVQPDCVDVHRFTALADDARARPEALREALALWNGPALADLAGVWVEEVRVHLHERRLATMLRWAEAVAPHDPDAVIDEARALLPLHPYAEPLAAALIGALAAAGRRPEALECYGDVRQRLAHDLGIDPGPALQELYRGLLQGTGRPVAPGRRPPAPNQLPLDVDVLVGRDADLAALDRALTADPAGARPALALLTGPAGVGKTALALRWAHRARGRYPDGRLHADLRGYDPETPLSVPQALTSFLRALGVPDAEIPAAPQELAALFRSVTDSRRLLLVVDNATESHDLALLLPSCSTCAVLVTSRDALPGVVARHGARRVELEPLPAQAAAALLHRLAGPRPLEPGVAEDVAAACEGLPLALRLAAELVASRVDVPPAELAAALRDQARTLDLLDAGGDDRTALRAVFSWSYRHLPDGVARVFRLLGLSPAASLDPFATAALAGRADDAARFSTVVDRLVRGHLVQRTAGGRLAMHDLLKAYAAELAAREDGDGACADAFGRLVTHELGWAADAMDALHPTEANRRPRIDATGLPRPAFAAPDAALAWMEGEVDALLALATTSPARGRPAATVLLAATLARHLERTGRLMDAALLHEAAYAAAAGDPSGRGTALVNLGNVRWLSGDYPRAADAFTEAVTVARSCGDLVVETRANANLGSTFCRWGRYREAEACHLSALAIAGRSGDRVSEARALQNLAGLQSITGRHADAVATYTVALTAFRDLGSVDGVARALSNLAEAHLEAGDLDLAAARWAEALPLLRSQGDVDGEADALDTLGSIHRRAGRGEEALVHHRRALAIFRSTGNRSGIARALNGLGAAHLALADGDDASAAFREALTLARELRSPIDQARAHEGLADCAGSLWSARTHRREALRLYVALGSPDAERVRDRLDEPPSRADLARPAASG